jgi:NAD(P)-dependent dehydrogenase (short-subunit alcohol dehydrogenase family)
MSAERPLDGKVIIVTGAGAGIGRGLALAYGQAGAKVVVASRTPATVEEVTQEIRAAGGEATGVPCDVGHRDQVYAMVDRTIEAYGALHVLVNNAKGFGTAAKPTISPVMRPFEETDEAEWDFTFRTGATATLWSMKAAFPHMKAAGYGRVINMSSAVGQTGAERRVAYNATKEAIRAMTRTAAREWGPYGITVNAISPFIHTRLIDILQRKMPEQYDEVVKAVPVRRAGTTERDLAPLAIFLAGEGSGYMTGQTFMVDGGSYITP